MAIDLAPRVLAYPFGATAPAAEQGWLVLPQLQEGEIAVFGDGSHPTTRLCAGAVDLLCRQRQPEAVLDVGTGTGVLARIARARGARFVVGTDIDATAIDFAKANAALDVHATRLQLGFEAPDHWGARFDLVVANILEEVLMQLAPALGRALSPSGVLLLSGFTRPQVPALRVCFEALGLRFVSESHLEEWVLLRLER